MSIDEQHVALPKLYGAPAYARPPGSVRGAPARSTRTSCRSRPRRPTRSARSPRPCRPARTRRRRPIGRWRPRRPARPPIAARGRSAPRADRRAASSAELPTRTTARPGVASPRGGVAQSVRAAGLYPAGSRFESWLPYQPRPDAGRARRSRRVPRAARRAASRRSTVRLRWRGSDAIHAGSCSAVTTAQAGAPARAWRPSSTIGGVDADDEVDLALAQPAAEPLRVAGHRGRADRSATRPSASASPARPTAGRPPGRPWTTATPNPPTSSVGSAGRRRVGRRG